MPDDEIHLATSVSHAFLEALGAITVNFGALENALRLSIWAMLSYGGSLPDEQSQIITAELSFKQLVWTTVHLYRNQFPGRNEETIGSYSKQCFEAEAKRNALIHSLWVDGTVGGEATATNLKLVAKKQFHVKAEEHTRQELVRVANSVGVLAANLRSFILGEVLTSRGGAG